MDIWDLFLRYHSWHREMVTVSERHPVRSLFLVAMSFAGFSVLLPLQLRLLADVTQDMGPVVLPGVCAAIGTLAGAIWPQNAPTQLWIAVKHIHAAFIGGWLSGQAALCFVWMLISPRPCP